MYSGFVTHRHSIRRIGIHQRLDSAAYRMVRTYFAPGSFPSVKQILHFEGVNGPDGLKIKSPGSADPDHFYDPISDTGDVPKHIISHYKQLVAGLEAEDMVRAAFEASWLAHYVVDGLTPAHHVLITKEIERICGGQLPQKGKFKYVATGEGAVKKNWAIWGTKGIIPMHHGFEVGIAASMLGRPMRVRLDPVKLAKAREIGYLQYFKEEAIEVSHLGIYQEFIQKGWTASIAASVRNRIAPVAIQLVLSGCWPISRLVLRTSKKWHWQQRSNAHYRRFLKKPRN